MKIEIKVECSDITIADMAKEVTMGINIQYPDGTIHHHKEMLDEVEHRCIESFMQRLVYNRDKLIQWVKDGNSVSARLTLVAPEGVKRKDLKEL